MVNFSKAKDVSNCPFCESTSQLQNTDNFFVVCDSYPITRGHILIIPKKHISCFAEYPPSIFQEFIHLYNKCSKFIKTTYGSISTFEHGIIGQTVFHSHIQMFPFRGSEKDIVPEGLTHLTQITNFDELKSVYEKEKKYLFFSIEEKMWVVDTKIGMPRFFRDRFAAALHHPERGNWKEMRENKSLMEEVEKEKKELQEKWNAYFS